MRARLITLTILALLSALTVSCTHKGMMKKDSMHQDSMMQDQGMKQDQGTMEKKDTM